MPELQKTYSELAINASQTAHDYLFRAIESVNELMGPGAAKEHPEVVIAVMNAASKDYLASMLSHRVVPALNEIADAIRAAGDDIRGGLSE